MKQRFRAVLQAVIVPVVDQIPSQRSRENDEDIEVLVLHVDSVPNVASVASHLLHEHCHSALLAVGLPQARRLSHRTGVHSLKGDGRPVASAHPSRT
jgi:hypothetical protein